MPTRVCPCCGEQVNGMHRACAAQGATYMREMLNEVAAPLLAGVQPHATAEQWAVFASFRADGDLLTHSSWTTYTVALDLGSLLTWSSLAA